MTARQRRYKTTALLPLDGMASWVVELNLSDATGYEAPVFSACTYLLEGIRD